MGRFKSVIELRLIIRFIKQKYANSEQLLIINLVFYYRRVQQKSRHFLFPNFYILFIAHFIKY